MLTNYSHLYLTFPSVSYMLTQRAGKELIRRNCYAYKLSPKRKLSIFTLHHSLFYCSSLFRCSLIHNSQITLISIQSAALLPGHFLNELCGFQLAQAHINSGWC